MTGPGRPGGGFAVCLGSVGSSIMARLMPNGRCDVIRDAGHLAWIDQLDICAERIGSFLTT
jgi:pimeloyl-ACP methyl ester carboxylesterase